MATDGAAIMCADLDSAAAENTANIIIQQAEGLFAEALALDGASENAVKSAKRETGRDSICQPGCGIQQCRYWRGL